MAKRASCQGEATSRDTLRWTDEMDTTFIDALIEECRKGNRVDGTFTTMAYDNIFSHLRSIYGNHIRKENLKNRLKTLKDLSMLTFSLNSLFPSFSTHLSLFIFYQVSFLLFALIFIYCSYYIIYIFSLDNINNTIM
ncbi:hypothetical protein AHAS_Ahas02G0093600 [Arachis hypogaea]